jgi:hypothetical protein
MRPSLNNAHEQWYTLGDRIRVTAAIDLEPYGVLPVGARGTVAYVDQETCYTEILMDDRHDCLHEWRNHLWLIPPDTDEIEAAIVRMPKKRKATLRLLVLAASFVALLVLQQPEVGAAIGWADEVLYDAIEDVRW